MQSTQTNSDPAEIEAPGRRFRKYSVGGVVAYVDPAYLESVKALGLFEPGGLESAIAGEAPTDRGHLARGPSAILELPDQPDRLHLRLFHHGGWLGGALGSQLFGLTRPLHELKVNSALEVAGAPVPRAIFALGERTTGPFFRVGFGTIHVERSQSGLEFLREARGLNEQEKLVAAAAVGAALRRFHDEGARHPDLHLGNLLLLQEKRQIRALVIDLDRAEIGPPPTPRRRMNELMRLHRSIIKHGLVENLGAKGMVRFFDAYTDGDLAFRRALLRHLPVERIRLALHRFTYSRRS